MSLKVSLDSPGRERPHCFCPAADQPERDHVAQFGGQAAELIGRQVQVDQVGQLGDVRRDAGQVVVIDVQCCQVSERP